MFSDFLKIKNRLKYLKYSARYFTITIEAHYVATF